MILVLLYRFSESEDSILGYTLCKKLVQEGHHLLVTTTAKKEEVKRERQNARELSERYEGSVTLLEPEYEEEEEPSPKWITKLHKTYFGYLSQLQDLKVHTVVGTLPGTTKTGVDLKKALKCKLVLLAATKIGTHREDLEKEVYKLAGHADEIWSVGPDLFSFFHLIFQKCNVALHQKHKEIIFKPDSEPTYRNYSFVGTKISSLWNHGHQIYFKGQKQKSRGSSKQNFEILADALALLNVENKMRGKAKLIWHAHGLKDEEDRQKTITLDVPKDIGLIPLTKTKVFADVINKIGSTATFIVPDENEDTFNFAALTAIWKGIPTLVSSHSSVGKWLLKHSVLNAERTMVSLTGDPEKDRDMWIQKIKQEILESNSNPKHWTQELSEYLQKEENQDLWKADLSILGSINNKYDTTVNFISLFLIAA